MRPRYWVTALVALPPLAAAVQSALGTRFLSLSVFVLAPLIASTWLRWPAVTALGLYSLAVAAAMAFTDPTFDAVLDVSRLASICPVLLLAVVNSRVRERREAQLRSISAVARAAQGAILREPPAAVSGLPTVARYRSAAAEASVGGDLYEVLPWDSGLRLVVGDVRGKGLEAVRTAARTVAAFREAADTPGSTLADVVARVDRSTCQELGEEDFVTAVVAELSADGVLRVANCGHVPPVLVGADGTWTELLAGRPSPPLGLHPHPHVEEFDVPAGGRLLFYSDGLVEARNRRGEFFPLSAHVGDLARGTLAEGVDRLLDALVRFSPALSDDLVVLAVERPAQRAPQRAPRVARPAAGAGWRRVYLPDLPTERFVSAWLHAEDLVRELAATPGHPHGHPHGDPEVAELARRVSALAGESEEFRAALRAQAVEAVAQAGASFTAVLDLPVGCAPVVAAFRDVLAESDRLGAAGRLPVPAAEDGGELLRHVLGLVVAQLHGNGAGAAAAVPARGARASADHPR